MPIHKFDKLVFFFINQCSTDALYAFLTAFSVVVSSLETLKTDHDEKTALYLNAILKFEFNILLVVAEHILSSPVTLIYMTSIF